MFKFTISLHIFILLFLCFSMEAIAQGNLRKKARIEDITIFYFNTAPSTPQTATPPSRVDITQVTGVLFNNNALQIRINWQAVTNVTHYQVIVKVGGQEFSTQQIQGTESIEVLPIANATVEVPISVEVRSICGDCEETYSDPQILNVVYKRYLYNYTNTNSLRFGETGAPTMPISDIEDVYPGSAFDCSTSNYARYSPNSPVYVYKKSSIASCVLMPEAEMLSCMATATKYISLNIENQNCGGANTQALRNNIPNTPDIPFFPNPATNEAYLTLELTQSATATLFISDLKGSVVLTQKADLLPLKNVLLIPIETLPSGLYFYHLSTLEKTISGKFMKTL